MFLAVYVLCYRAEQNGYPIVVKCKPEENNHQV